MARDRARDESRLDEPIGQGAGNEPQPSDRLPEAAVGQTEDPRQGLGGPDQSAPGHLDKARDGDPLAEGHSSQQAGRARNPRGLERAAREESTERPSEEDLFGPEQDL